MQTWSSDENSVCLPVNVRFVERVGGLTPHWLRTTPLLVTVWGIGFDPQKGQKSNFVAVNTENN